jgi:hypothetical protein
MLIFLVEDVNRIILSPHCVNPEARLNTRALTNSHKVNLVMAILRPRTHILALNKKASSQGWRTGFV